MTNSERPDEAGAQEPARPRPLLHPSLERPMEAVRTILCGCLGEELVSLTAIGPEVEEGRAKNEPLETLVVAGGDLLARAREIAAVGDKLSRAKLAPPLLMTEAYIAASLDVFPIELLHMQRFHFTAVGPDPLADLEFGRAHVRTQCEREAKRFLLHLRQGLMRCRGRRAAVRAVLRELFSGCVPLLGAVLYLKDVPCPRSREGIVAAFGKAMEAPAEPLLKVLRDARGTEPLGADRLESTLGECYGVLETLAEWVDAAC